MEEVKSVRLGQAQTTADQLQVGDLARIEKFGVEFQITSEPTPTGTGKMVTVQARAVTNGEVSGVTTVIQMFAGQKLSVWREEASDA